MKGQTDPVSASAGPLQAACRECCAPVETGLRRCPECGSVRVVTHRSLFSLAVAHIDCDAFYAAIEKRDNPHLRARPVIVGGGRRGVVATCCYVARAYGVRSAMPMFKALKACPDAVVLPPRMAQYQEEGRAIRSMLLELTPLVESVSIDEAYLDLSGTSAVHGAAPAISLMRLQKRIEDERGLTISVGLSENKFLAKTASEADKPRGFFVVDAEEAPEWLAARPVRSLHGVGAALASRLETLGYTRVSDLQTAPADLLVRRLGEAGRLLSQRAFGRDARPVRPERERRSVSSEVTLEKDVSAREEIEDWLFRVCVRTADRAKAAGVEGGTIQLKLKTARHETITRQAALSRPTQLARDLFRTALRLLERIPDKGPWRLIGVGLSDLGPAGEDCADLADPGFLKKAAAERAADRARLRFGAEAVTTGRGARLASGRRRNGDPAP